MKQSMVLRRQRKRDKVVVGQGSKECVAGFERNSFRELRVRWRGLVGRWEVGHKRASRGVLQTEHGFHKREKGREKLAVEPGPGGCKAGYETDNCGELRVRWGNYAHEERAGRTWRAKVLVANKTRPIQKSDFKT